MMLDKVKIIDVMIVGAEKAGTTSLAAYLGNHPNICTHKKREMNYFVVDEEFKNGYSHAYERYYLDCAKESKLILGKSVGICTNAYAVKRLYEHNPNMHLIFVLRNPIDRAYSAYWYSRRRGWEDCETFEAAIQREMQGTSVDTERRNSTTYLANGNYIEQIQLLQKFFAKSQIHIFTFDELKANPQSICRDLFAVLGLDVYMIDTTKQFNVAASARSRRLAIALSHRGKYKKYLRRVFPRKITDKIKNILIKWNEVTSERPVMRAETRQMLAEYYRSQIDGLSLEIGKEIPW